MARKTSIDHPIVDTLLMFILLSIFGLFGIGIFHQIVAQSMLSPDSPFYEVSIEWVFERTRNIIFFISVCAGFSGLSIYYLREVRSVR